MLRNFSGWFSVVTFTVVAWSGVLADESKPAAPSENVKTADERQPEKGPANAPEAAPKSDQPAKSDTLKAAEGKPRFLRLVRDSNKKPVALETAIVTYVPVDPARGDITIELVGAVHVGEKAYYEALNKEFEQYEALLYELVAPENTRIPKERKGGTGSAVGTMQVGMKEMLELEFQLDRIDYTKQNFVHADMSPEEFAKSMADRGESFAKMFFTMMGYGFAQQGETNDQLAQLRYEVDDEP